MNCQSTEWVQFLFADASAAAAHPCPRPRPATNYAWTFRHLNALQALFRFQFDSEFECEFSEIKDIDLFSD